MNEAIEVSNWFYTDLIFVNTKELRPDVIYDLSHELKGKNFKERFIALLKYADFNIIDMDILDSYTTDSKWGTLSTASPFSYLIATHVDENDNTIKLPLTEESEGTQNFIIVIAELLLANKTGDKVFLFDEFNSSFHLGLSQAIMDLINREKQNNQFILTTHELSLMNHDLRLDQIYFTEKSKNGSTDVFSLSDFDDPVLERNDVDYKKRYFSGRYGAVPIISPSILQCILEEEDEEDIETE